MSLDATKIASLSLLTLITLFVGLLPIKLYDYIKRREENAANKSKYLRAEFIMSLVLCLGGGVLIATAFLHMLPEARENITFGLSQGVHAAEEHVHAEPAADAIRFDHGHDEHGHAGHDHAHDHGHGDAHDHDHGIQDNANANANANAMEFGQDHASKRTLSKRRILHSETSTEAGVSIADEAENHEHAHNYPWTELILSLGCLLIYFIEEVGHALLEKSAKKPEQVQLARTFSVRGSGRKPVSIPRVSPQKMTTTPSEASTLPAMELGEAKKSTANLIADESHHHGHMLPLESVESFTDGLRAAVAVLAVSVHALFEGLAIGLEDEPQNVWIVFAAVGAHKFMIAFSIGMELVATNTRKLLIFIYTFCFAIVSPVGVGIGMLITRLTTGEGASSETQKLVLGVLQSLAAGTIVYVAFFEILQREKARTQGGPKGYVQFLLIAIGFSVMAVLEALTPHSHSH